MWLYNIKIDPTESIVKGKKKHNKSKSVHQLYSDECRDLRGYTDAELNDMLRESKLIAAGQQFDSEIASRATTYSAFALMVSIFATLFSVAKKAVTDFIIGCIVVEVILILLFVFIGNHFIQKSVEASYLREYHNFRAECIEDVLNERKKGVASIAQNGSTNTPKNTAP